MNKYKIGKVPKCGAMDSKFFSNPNGLDEKLNKRREFICEVYGQFEEWLNTYGTEYVEQGLGTKENFEKDVIRLMMLKRM
ncbi:MAG TPA: hypothetical protein DCM59_02665 [Clostridium sp.]|nr:hypothetical protein [Clostridium sp.]